MAKYEKRPTGQITKNIGGLSLPPGSRTTRCRETHDTPKGFSSRCILEAEHAYKPVQIPNRPGYGMLRQHEDKYGNRW